MKKFYHRISPTVFLIFFLLGVTFRVSAINKMGESVSIDEEYTKFKKQGDEFFSQGDYKKALKKYFSCLEVPNFANDEYAKKQVQMCEKIINLNEEASNAIDKKKNRKAIEYLEEIYRLNKADIITKKKLKELYSNIGFEKMKNSLFQEAIDSFKTSLMYGSDKQIESWISTCQEKIPTPNSNKSDSSLPVEKIIDIIIDKPTINVVQKKSSPFGKIVIGAVGAGAVFYALKINNDWTSTLKAVTTAKESGDINAYEKAYTNAQSAKGNESVRNLFLGVAIAAVVTEVYLLIRKPRHTISNVNFAPSNNTLGLSVNYKF